MVVSVTLYSFNIESIMNIPTRYFKQKSIVTATIYKPYKKINKTADGTLFTKNGADTTKIIAVSRDLKKKYPFGTKVLVIGAGILDGIYEVRDLMGFDKSGKPWKNKIDILVSTNHENVKFKNVQLIALSSDFKPENIL